MSFTRSIFTAACGLAIAVGGCSSSDSADQPLDQNASAVHLTQLYGVTSNDTLVMFTAGDPCTTTERRITGLAPDETVLGIDFRPATGQLYALGSTSQIYTIDPATGIATKVGTPFTPMLQGTSFGFDFNPVVDRIRIVSDAGQNLRVHPDTGAVAAVDGSLAYASTDRNAGATPSVAGAAYTNPVAGTTSTTLYDIDVGLDVLTTQSPPNSGTLNTVGSLGVKANTTVGFDISQAGIGYAVLKTSGKPDKDRCGNTELFTVDLATGMVTSRGYIGSKQPVTDLAVFLPDPTP